MTSSPEPESTAATAPRARVECHTRELLSEGWQAARCEPDAHTSQRDIDGLDWIGARVPGTAAGALRDAGLWHGGDWPDLDAQAWWFRTSFQAGAAGAGEQALLCLGGVATVAEVHLNGELILHGDSLFAAHA